MMRPTAAQIRNIRVERHVPVFSKELKRSPFDPDANAYPGLGGRAKFHEFVNDSRFVIRLPEHHFSGSKATIIRTCVTARRLFWELQEKYKVPVAPVQFVVARNPEGKLTYYGITQKVTPVEIDARSDTEQALVYAGLEKIYLRIINYLEDKVQTREEFLDDILSAQYVYGTIPGNSSPQWYLVDTDPVFNKGTAYLKNIMDDDYISELETDCRTKSQELRRRMLEFRDGLYRRRKKPVT